jgi:hypothetical protein
MAGVKRWILVAAAIVGIPAWSLNVARLTAPDWTRQQIMRVTEPECVGAPKNVEYHDGMTLCPGQSVEIQIPLSLQSGLNFGVTGDSPETAVFGLLTCDEWIDPHEVGGEPWKIECHPGDGHAAKHYEVMPRNL